MSDEAYYVPVGTAGEDRERFAPTASTESTWATTMQHGAPPSALLVRSLERCAAREDTRLTRVVVEILGPIPVVEIEVRSRVERPGKLVEMVVAEMWAPGPDGSERAVARATAWRMQTSDSAAVVSAADAPLPPVSEASDTGFSGMFTSTGYLNSLTWRRLREPVDGPGQVWARPTTALVQGEAMSPLQRLFAVADSANGVGSKLHPSDWTFLNTELTVHVFRVPTGEWVGIEAETSYGPDGIGMCAGVLHDQDGPVGRIAQALQIRSR
ncbi:thioesterase family protein [Rhodococcus gannanensis]|uniref:Thioesterase family protein n=1 Tax=Rhodococcus gannanensis TaxID=1960308 RepID=A0ABW4P9K8_9NOCA